MDEKRVTQRVLTYWKGLCKNSAIPEVTRFNHAAIEEVWPYCFRVAVIKGKVPVYKYEYMGSAIASLYGKDLTGMTVDSRASTFPGSILHQRLDEVITDPKAVHDENHLLNLDGKLIKYRACILPLGNEKVGVTHVVVGLSCRFF